VQSLSPVLRGTLLALSTLTIMAGATIAPGLPRMQQHFADVENAGLLVRLVLTVVALSVALFSPVAGILADKFGRKPLFSCKMC
jgi:MFS family permease